jgi:NAD(P)-dependent dehydrogenase (short-subunit alcohol dehydrogenase family)
MGLLDGKVAVITGASKGIGKVMSGRFAAEGAKVVCSARTAAAVELAAAEITKAGGRAVAVAADASTEDGARSLMDATVKAFGRIDVLVNNAGNFYAGFFEELSPEDFRAQIETNLFGPVNVTRAVLPVMRAQRRGLIVTISSTGGISGQAFVSAYSAAKFGVEGWIESLAPEVAPFGIRTMLVEPGFFRTELLTDESTKWPDASIDDYAEKTRQTVTAWKKMNGLQGGDPAKLAKALIQLAGSDEPPLRWPAGADAVETFEKKAKELLAQASAHRALSSSLAHDDASK